MKITHKIISIPPYLSTSWRNVQALHMQDTLLVVTLLDGEAVYIPDLRTEEIEEIFHSHRAFLEQEEKEDQDPTGGVRRGRSAQGTGTPLNSALFGDMEADLPGGLGSLENLSTMLQHNPAQAHAPDLPKDMLEKVSTVAKMMGPQETAMMPKAEPHCNCMYCQIARAISGIAQEEEEEVEETSREEEEISSEELNFQQWDIEQTGDKLFQVTNRLDTEEHYSVYLGQPVGCTCGRTGCEHIVAVLQS